MSEAGFMVNETGGAYVSGGALSSCFVIEYRAERLFELKFQGVFA